MILANVVAMSLHLIAPLPQAGEATRLDLHGHLFLDLIGQRCPVGWSGRLRLVCMDLLVFVLQSLAVACAVDLKLRGAAPGESARAVASTTGDARPIARHPLDVDARLREEPEQGIELQPMGTAALVGPSSSIGSVAAAAFDVGAPSDEREGLLGSREEGPPSADSLALVELDRLYAGQACLLHLDLWHLIHSEYWERLNRRLAGRV